jgi:integrase
MRSGLGLQLRLPGSDFDRFFYFSDSQFQNGVIGEESRELVRRFSDGLILSACERHARQATRRVTDFLRRMEIVSKDQITTDAVRNYLLLLTADGLSAKTVLNAKSHISAFCAATQPAGVISINPCASIRCRQPDETPPPTIGGRPELGQLLLACRRLPHRGRMLCCAVLLAVATGMRLSEVCRLRWQDVQEFRRVLLVYKSKSKLPRIIPISRDAAIALRSMRRLSGGFRHVFPARRTWTGGWAFQGRGMAANRMLEWLAEVKDGFPQFALLDGKRIGKGFHLFRHSFGSLCAEHNTNLKKVQCWMGHSDIRMTDRYSHLIPRYDPEIERVLQRSPDGHTMRPETIPTGQGRKLCETHF